MTAGRFSGRGTRIDAGIRTRNPLRRPLRAVRYAISAPRIPAWTPSPTPSTRMRPAHRMSESRSIRESASRSPCRL